MNLRDVGDEVREEKCAHYGDMARFGGPCTYIYNEDLCPGCGYRGKWVTATTVFLGESDADHRMRE